VEKIAPAAGSGQASAQTASPKADAAKSADKTPATPAVQPTDDASKPKLRL
jgi:hypothetical protein